jgi:hypothetical protein
MLFHSVLRSFYSAIGLGNQVRIFFPSSKNFVCSHKHVTDFQKLVIESGVSASDYLEFIFFLHKFLSSIILTMTGVTHLNL